VTSHNPVVHESAVVIERGSRALELVMQRSPESVEALEAYAKALESWQRVFDEAIKSDGNDTAECLEVASAISEQHDKIVAATKELHGELGSSIKNLGGWMKGVRAYMGGSSERLTTMRPKKG
jgi:hypothetical protein